jgi:hypothetical protein
MDKDKNESDIELWYRSESAIIKGYSKIKNEQEKEREREREIDWAVNLHHLQSTDRSANRTNGRRSDFRLKEKAKGQ